MDSIPPQRILYWVQQRTLTFQPLNNGNIEVLARPADFLSPSADLGMIVKRHSIYKPSFIDFHSETNGLYVRAKIERECMNAPFSRDGVSGQSFIHDRSGFVAINPADPYGPVYKFHMSDNTSVIFFDRERNSPVPTMAEFDIKDGCDYYSGYSYISPYNPGCPIIEQQKAYFRKIININVEYEGFTVPDIEADTIINVYGTVFHVHSTVLKQYSTFFRQSMNSAYKFSASKQSSMRYEYVTVVSPDGEWTLKAKGKVTVRWECIEATISRPFWWNMFNEITAFKNLLCAMYTKPYAISCLSQLQRITELASFYGALPILSSSLTPALLRSRHLVNQIAHHSRAFLLIAHKLHHGLLFSESFAHYIDEWPKTREVFEDERLNQLLREKCYVLQGLIENAFYRLVCTEDAATTACQQSLPPPFVDAFLSLAELFDPNTCKCLYQIQCYPEYFAKIWNYGRGLGIGSHNLWSCIGVLFLHNLKLDTCKDRAGGGEYIDRFLCTEVEDYKFPWNLEEVDW